MLVNNAGFKERVEGDRTKYGTGKTWQINFLGPFLLTEFLARRRERDGVEIPCSVINVASGHESESNLDKQLLDSLEVGCESTGHDYADSKRALLLWTSVRSQSLALKGHLYTHAVSPGKVDTRFGCDHIPEVLWCLSKPFRSLLYRSQAEGALSIAAAGLRKHATSKFGQYFRGEELRLGDKQGMFRADGRRPGGLAHAREASLRAAGALGRHGHRLRAAQRWAAAGHRWPIPKRWRPLGGTRGGGPMVNL